MEKSKERERVLRSYETPRIEVYALNMQGPGAPGPGGPRPVEDVTVKASAVMGGARVDDWIDGGEI